MRRLFRFLCVCACGWPLGPWLLGLAGLVLLGLNAYARQLVHGLAGTGLTDQVFWGLYIASFSFAVGLSAAAAILALSAGFSRRGLDPEDVLPGLLLAPVSMLLCLLFAAVDVGRPDRLHHMLVAPNLAASQAAWDLFLLGGLLLLELGLCGALLRCVSRGRTPGRRVLVPVALLTLLWASLVLVAAAFQYAGLEQRPFWVSAPIAPTFLAAALAAGAAGTLLTVEVMMGRTDVALGPDGRRFLRRVLTMGLIACLVFAGREALASSEAPPLEIWIAIALDAAALLMISPPLGRRRPARLSACLLGLLGLWLGAGPGLILPASVVTPLGEVAAYRPSSDEWLVCLGIWALGLLLYTLSLRGAAQVLSGRADPDRCSSREAAALTPDVPRSPAHG